MQPTFTTHRSCSSRMLPEVHSADGWRARCDLRPELSALLGHRTLDGRALHFALVVDDHPCIVLEIDEGTFPPTPGLLLPNHHALEHLLPQFGLAFFHRAKDHVTWACLRDLVQPATIAAHCDNVQVLSSAVVSAIQHRCNAATKGHLQLTSTASSTSTLHGCSNLWARALGCKIP